MNSRWMRSSRWIWPCHRECSLTLQFDEQNKLVGSERSRMIAAEFTMNLAMPMWRLANLSSPWIWPWQCESEFTMNLALTISMLVNLGSRWTHDEWGDHDEFGPANVHARYLEFTMNSRWMRRSRWIWPWQLECSLTWVHDEFGPANVKTR